MFGLYVKKDLPQMQSMRFKDRRLWNLPSKIEIVKSGFLSWHAFSHFISSKGIPYDILRNLRNACVPLTVTLDQNISRASTQIGSGSGRETACPFFMAGLRGTTG